jgi:ethanolamine utilization microcompartment shell protein EutL
MTTMPEDTPLPGMPELPPELEEAPAGPVDQVGALRLDAGTYALYQTPNGAVVAVLASETYGEVRRQIPAAVVKMARGQGFFSGRMGKKLRGE